MRRPSGIGEHVAVTAHAGLALDVAPRGRRRGHRGACAPRPTSRSSSRWRCRPTTRSWHVYAVDSEDHLVAHPELGLVLRRPDLSSYGVLKRIRAELARGGGDPVVSMFAGRGLEGTDMMISAALIPSTNGWWWPSSPARRSSRRYTSRSCARSG